MDIALLLFIASGYSCIVISNVTCGVLFKQENLLIYTAFHWITEKPA